MPLCWFSSVFHHTLQLIKAIKHTHTQLQAFLSLLIKASVFTWSLLQIFPSFSPSPRPPFSRSCCTFKCIDEPEVQVHRCIDSIFPPLPHCNFQPHFLQSVKTLCHHYSNLCAVQQALPGFPSNLDSSLPRTGIRFLRERWIRVQQMLDFIDLKREKKR